MGDTSSSLGSLMDQLDASVDESMICHLRLPQI